MVFVTLSLHHCVQVISSRKELVALLQSFLSNAPHSAHATPHHTAEEFDPLFQEMESREESIKTITELTAGSLPSVHTLLSSPSQTLHRWQAGWMCRGKSPTARHCVLCRTR